MAHKRRHADEHATGQGDELSPADIGAATAGDLTTHTGDTSNPHAVTASQVGISDLDDIADGSSYERVKASEVLEGQVVNVAELVCSADFLCNFNESPFIDIAGHTLTINGSATLNTSIKKYGAGSLYIPGNGSYLESSGSWGIANGEDFTIEFDLYLVAAPADFGMVLCCYRDDAGSTGWQIGVAADQTIHANFQGNYTNSAGSISTGEWHHIRVVRGAGVIRIYLDGTVDANTISYSGACSTVAAHGLLIGDTIEYDSRYFNGVYIDNARICFGFAINSGNFTPPASEITSLDALETISGASIATAVEHAAVTSGNPHSVSKSDVGLANVANVDTTNPANITEDATHRFATDTEKSTWNGKQDALGFTAVPDTRTVNGQALSADVEIVAGATYTIWQQLVGETLTYYAVASPETGLSNFSDTDFVGMLEDILDLLKVSGTWSPQNNHQGSKIVVRDGLYFLTSTLNFPVLQDFEFDAGFAGFQYVPTTGDGIVFDSCMNCRFNFGEVHSGSGTSGATIKLNPTSDMFGDTAILTSIFRFGAASNTSGDAIVLKPGDGRIIHNQIFCEELLDSVRGFFIDDISGSGSVVLNDIHLKAWNDDNPIQIGEPIPTVLLHMDGDDESTTFTDEMGHTFTAQGAAQIDTAQSVFGGASCLLNGTDAYLSSADHADWNIGSANLILDTRVRYSTIPVAGTYYPLVEQWESAANSWDWFLYGANGNVTMYFATAAGGTTWLNKSAGTIVADTWYRFKIVRIGNTMYAFKDNALLGSQDVTGKSVGDYSGTLRIGYTQNWDSYHNGWVDEFRFVKGYGDTIVAHENPTVAYRANRTGVSKNNFFVNLRALDKVGSATTGIRCYRNSNIFHANIDSGSANNEVIFYSGVSGNEVYGVLENGGTDTDSANSWSAVLGRLELLSGDFSIKGITNDGSTAIYSGKDSDGVEVYSLDTNGKVNVYNGLSAEGMGHPVILDVLDLAGQGADITSTNFANCNTDGLYRISYSLLVTTADGAAGDITLTIGWTDGVGATTKTENLVLTTTGRATGVIFVQLASGNITYAVAHTGDYGTSEYALYCTAERLS